MYIHNTAKSIAPVIIISYNGHRMMFYKRLYYCVTHRVYRIATPNFVISITGHHYITSKTNILLQKTRQCGMPYLINVTYGYDADYHRRYFIGILAIYNIHYDMYNSGINLFL